MRFGKKLALQSNSDPTGAPYISHGSLKTTIERFSRELKVVTATNHAATMDQMFFQILLKDVSHILRHIQNTENGLAKDLGIIQRRAIDLGIIYEKDALEQLAKTISYKSADPDTMCQYLLGLKLLDSESAPAIRQVMVDFDKWLVRLDQHTKYIEINAAGFRKLLKQREKQITKLQFSAEKQCIPLNDFSWTELVTNQVRLLIRGAHMMKVTFTYIGEVLKCPIEMRNAPSLGTESYTCVMIRKDLLRGISPIQWMDVRQQQEK